MRFTPLEGIRSNKLLRFEDVVERISQQRIRYGVQRK